MLFLNAKQGLNSRDIPKKDINEKFFNYRKEPADTNI